VVVLVLFTADYMRDGSGDQEMNNDTFIVPEENRLLVVTETEWVIEVSAETRLIEVPHDPGQ
jgi:hypothetical protein